MDTEHFYIPKEDVKYTITIEVAGGTEQDKMTILQNISFEKEEDIMWVGLQIDKNYGSFNRKIYGIKKN